MVVIGVWWFLVAFGVFGWVLGGLGWLLVVLGWFSEVFGARSQGDPALGIFWSRAPSDSPEATRKD